MSKGIGVRLKTESKFLTKLLLGLYNVDGVDMRKHEFICLQVINMKDFGVHRVLEPNGVVPVTAWRLDNSAEIGPKELRIDLEMIHMEWDSFNQICSHCGFDESKMKARLIQIVDERGKLHNPYTDSGGLFIGTVAAMGEELSTESFAVGDRIISLSTLTGMAMHIENIEKIDFDYGQVTCKGYVIAFEATDLAKYSEQVPIKYLLPAIDEGGNFRGVSRALENEEKNRIAIIGSNLITTILYAQILKETCGEDSQISAILDQDAFVDFTAEALTEAVFPVIDKVHFVDLSQPVEAFQRVMEWEGTQEEMDAVVNLEDIVGSETLSTLLVKERSLVFYTSLKNNYTTGLLVADSMGKEIIPYALDGYVKDAQAFASGLVSNVLGNLERIDAMYGGKKRKSNSVASKKRENNGFSAVQKIDDFVYQSPVTRAMVNEALNVAQYDCNVIIQGETGVGKEKIFDIIHQNSPRQGKPCVKINCATIQESLAESEFFGYEKGAFTGAQSSGKAGYFELANNGTLFLDEIGSLSLNMQSKLLRVLQDNTYYRVGGTEQKHTNVRVICANNVSLRKLVEDGLFREDLFYRLNICSIEVPALRNRKEDIHCLAETFIRGYSKKYGVEKEFDQDAYEKLESYPWPGNVRELENAVHRMYISERERIIGGDTVDHLLNAAVYEELIVNIRKEIYEENHVDFNQIMEEQEKRLIAYALKKEGTTRKAAEYLNLPQATLARKKVRYGL